MGGNVSLSKNNKIYKAQKIPVKDIGLKQFQKDFINLFLRMNKLFEKEFKRPIWLKTDYLKNGEMFNGSTSYMMSSKGLDVIDLKPAIGDIDLIVPEELKDDLWDFLNKLEDKFITKNIKYIGNNKPTKSSIGEQINALFEYHIDNNVFYVQVDFEFLEFENSGEKPSEWAKFSHSSTIDDLKIGVKAVFARYLERSLSRILTRKNGIFVTKMANCNNWEKKIKKKQGETLENEHILKFSLKYGLRTAYEPLICDDKELVVDGKKVYKEIASKDSEYIQDLKTIFEILFGKEPVKNELNDFWSFKGKIELMKKYLDKKEIENIFLEFLKLLWEAKGNKNIAQELERDNSDLDAKIKIAAVNYFLKEFPFLKKYEKQIEEMSNKYYQNYGIRGLKENLIEIIENKSILAIY